MTSLNELLIDCSTKGAKRTRFRPEAVRATSRLAWVSHGFRFAYDVMGWLLPVTSDVVVALSSKCVGRHVWIVDVTTAGGSHDRQTPASHKMHRLLRNIDKSVVTPGE